MEFQKNIDLPSNLSFSLEAYLKIIGEQLISGTVKEINYDSSFKLFGILLKMHRSFFELFNIAEAIDYQETKETIDGQGGFDFPEEVFEGRYGNSKANYTVKLFRAYNGHMGYNEDTIKVVFNYGEKECSFLPDLFLNNILNIRSIHFTKNEFDKIIRILETALFHDEG